MATARSLKLIAVTTPVQRLGAASRLCLAAPLSSAFAFHKAYAPVTSTVACPGDRKVWVNTRTGIYHLEGERWYGRTRQGQFECEKAAKAEGDRETENGQ